MIAELRHQYLSEESGRRDTLVDDVSSHRLLRQRLALGACPFTADVPLNCEHAWRVIELLADVLAYALQLAAARAERRCRFVVQHNARQVRRQCLTARLVRFGEGLRRCG